MLPEKLIPFIKTGLNNNITIITGLAGSGKSSVVKGILTVLKNRDFVQVALSGRAASRLTEITGQEGSTIHRTLGFPKGPENKQKFEFHDENRLDKDIYILDEISMVYLTKIHRQAARSAIVTESIKVRNGEQLTDKEWVGTEIRGELQDLVLQCYSDKTNTYHRIIEAFKAYQKKEDFNIMETQIIVPVKNRGDACTTKLNIAIQDIVNPRQGQHVQEIYRDGTRFELRVGDKVINRQNNYKTTPYIYNGNMGILRYFDWDEELEEDVMVVDFKAIGFVRIPKKYWGAIDLAYAITVHSDQGSEHDNVIFGLDFASYSLLTRELVYTGITRARKRCELIAQTSALRIRK